jgi:hypothetical protein
MKARTTTGGFGADSEHEIPIYLACEMIDRSYLKFP